MAETQTAKHTPGPWTYRVVTGTCATRIYGGGKIICEMAYHPGEQRERHANRDLITAAPETAEQRDMLLEACKELASQLDRVINLNPAGMSATRFRRCRTAIGAAAAAIAKAEP